MGTPYEELYIKYEELFKQFRPLVDGVRSGAVSLNEYEKQSSNIILEAEYLVDKLTQLDKSMSINDKIADSLNALHLAQGAFGWEVAGVRGRAIQRWEEAVKTGTKKTKFNKWLSRQLEHCQNNPAWQNNPPQDNQTHEAKASYTLPRPEILSTQSTMSNLPDYLDHKKYVCLFNPPPEDELKDLLYILKNRYKNIKYLPISEIASIADIYLAQINCDSANAMNDEGWVVIKIVKARGCKERDPVVNQRISLHYLIKIAELNNTALKDNYLVPLPQPVCLVCSNEEAKQHVEAYRPYIVLEALLPPYRHLKDILNDCPGWLPLWDCLEIWGQKLHILNTFHSVGLTNPDEQLLHNFWNILHDFSNGATLRTVDYNRSEPDFEQPLCKCMRGKELMEEDMRKLIRKVVFKLLEQNRPKHDNPHVSGHAEQPSHICDWNTIRGKEFIPSSVKTLVTEAWHGTIPPEICLNKLNVVRSELGLTQKPSEDWLKLHGLIQAIVRKQPCPCGSQWAEVFRDLLPQFTEGSLQWNELQRLVAVCCA